MAGGSVAASKEQCVSAHGKEQTPFVFYGALIFYL